MARLDEVPDAMPARSTETVADPPWPRETEEPPPAPGDPALTPDVRPAPPSVGVPQQCTTVQLVGGGDSYQVVLDGVAVGAVSLADDGVDKFWLPRYRERMSEPEGAKPSRRLAAPVCLGVRVEEGQAAPLRCKLRVKQRVWDRRTVVMDDVTTQTEAFLPHTVSDLESQYVLLPYPAAITTPPHVHIYDCDRLRRWEAQRRRWTNSRFWKIVQSITGVIRGGTGMEATSALWKSIMGRASGDNWAKTIWQALGLAVSPRLRAAVSSALAIKELVWNGYEAQSSPPAEMRTYKYGIDELIDSIRTIEATRADGARAKRRWGLTPSEMSSQQMQKEAALLYWLLYGNQSVLNNEQLNRLADPEDAPGGLVTRLASRRSWAVFFNDQSPLTGNFLSVRGLDPHALRATRIEIIYELEIESHARDDGGAPEAGRVRRKLVRFEPLLSNALDAGYLLQDIKGQLDKLEDAMEGMRKRLGTLKTYGFNWMQGKLFVSDTSSGGLFGGLNRLWPVGTWRDQQLRERWAALSSEERRGALSSTALTINPSQFVRRMKRIIGAPEDAPDPEGRRGQNVGYVFGTSGPKYERRLARLKRLHRMSLGVPERAYEEGDPLRTRNFWRWVQHHVPILGPGADERLYAFSVPEPVAAWVAEPPELVRRMAQLGRASQWLASTFGRTSLLTVVTLSYDDPHSERKLAKAAADAARACWRITTEDYLRLRWVVEAVPPVPPEYPMAFHFLQCYTLPEGASLPDRRVERAGAATDVLCASFGLTEELLLAEERHTRSGRADLAWAAAAAAGGTRYGDAAVAALYGLAPTRPVLAALAAFATLLVHRVVDHNVALERVELVQSAVCTRRRPRRGRWP